MATGNTQQIIDYGTTPNDGTGDPLRTAFIKTDENFDNVWLAGPVGSNVRINNNTVSTINTNGNIIIKPDGVGIIQANASIVPNSTDTRDLGSANLVWRRLYVGTLSAADIAVTGNLTVDGNIIQIGNLVTDALTIQLANTATTANAANGAGITVGAYDNTATMLYSSSSNVWNTNIGITAVGNVTAPYFIGNGSLLTGISSTGDYVFANNLMSIANTTMEISATGTGADIDIEAADAVFIEALGSEVDIRSAAETFITTGSGTHVWTFDNDGSLDAPGNITANYFIGDGSLLTGITSYANANVVAYGQAGWAGNIIPATSNTYSLGNATNQWSDLYVSNATIYMNNVPIGLTAGNTLTVNGAEVVTTSDNDANIGNLAIYSATITIKPGAADEEIFISPSGESWAFLQLPINDTANVTDTRLHNDAGNVEIGAGDLSNGGNSYEWVFDNTGTLIFPASQASIYGGLDNDFIINTANANAATYTFTFSQFGNLSVPVDLIVGNDLYAADLIGPNGNITVTANTQSWLFDNNGTLTLPGNSQILPAGNTGVRFSAGASDITGLFLNNDGDAELYANASVSIYADSDDTAQGWTFDTTGNLTLPNNGSIIVDDDGVIGPDGDDMVISWDNEELILRSVEGSVELQADNDVDIKTGYIAGDYQYKWVFGNNNELVNITGDSAIVTEAGNLAISGGRDGLSSGNVTVRAVDVGVAVRDWTFDNNGDLTVPNYIYFKDGSFIGDEGGALPPVFRVDAPLGLGIDLTTDSNISGNNHTWSFGIDGVLTLPGNIVSDIRIAIDNRSANDLEDIEIYSADNILLQARDQTDPNNTEGGDIDIYAGDGSPDDDINGAGGGGDIQIFAGRGGTANTVYGGPGGQIRIEAGDGGAGSASNAAGAGSYVRVYAGSGGADNGGGGAAGGDIDISAGDSSDAAQDRGSITLTSGSGGDETTVGGYVEINIPSVGTNPGGSWIFSGTGTVLETPSNAEIFNVNAGNLTVGSAGNTIVRTIGAGLTTYDWVFDPTGDLILPGGNTEIYVANAVGNTAGNSISITGGDADQTAYYATPGGNVNISGGLGAFNDGGGGGQGGSVNISSGLSADPAGIPGNVNIDTGDYTWTYSYNGDLWLPGGTGYIGSAANTISIYSNEAETNGMLFYDNGGGDAGAEIYAANNFAIFADNDSNGNTWRFYGNALMSAPGDISTPGNISGNTAGYAIGYRDIPQISFTGNATIATTDAGKHFYSTQSTDYILTIANNASQGFQVGAAISIVNQGTGNITIAQGSGVTLYLAGNATSGNRTISTFGMATIMKVATDTWFINGTGVA